MNDGIPRELSTVYHAIVNDAVSLIKKSGRGSALAKTDIKSAFRVIPVHPSDYELLLLLSHFSGVQCFIRVDSGSQTWCTEHHSHIE